MYLKIELIELVLSVLARKYVFFYTISYWKLNKLKVIVLLTTGGSRQSLLSG